jgi:two-component system chemotaxis sensor kinase CheA
LEANTVELQEEIFSLRMLPLELVLGSLPKMVEETAILLGKNVDFSVSGSDLMIDKIILESLHDPIIHLVRNAIDHGIETSEERQQKGKSATAHLTISCYLESGNIMISIQDDGRGLDYEKIRQKALRLYPAQAEEILAMDPVALHGYIFTSGFSTRDQAQELSGRGVGMDIVKHNIEAIKGRITLQSETDQGTEFLLTLPLSLATVEGFFVRCAEEKFLIPSTFVQEVLSVKRSQHVHLGQKEAIRLRDKIIPIYYLSSILGKNGTGTTQEKHFVLVVESVGNMIGIVVDAILQYDSLIYKPLPPNLGNLDLLQGIVFDESYNIINILFVPALMERFKHVRLPGKVVSADATRQRHTVLVVDDSYSTREIERSILELENYHVVTAGDGLDGLEKLQQHQVDLIITDIRMPRLDGLGFVERVRQQPQHARTPIIVVSTVDDSETRQQFIAKQVNSFIVKADFERGNLAAEVNKLLGE